jgi:4-hydroxy-tetrahydrodipicolinate reductase
MEQKVLNQKWILIVGLSGSMGRLTAGGVFASKEYKLVPFGIVAPNDNREAIIRTVSFSQLTERDMEDIENKQPIIIDFTHKDVIKSNWEKYYQYWGCPLIIGTIGIKKEDIIGNKAPVIIGSPNLCPQIVEILRTFSELEPESLKGMKFEIEESHQASKNEVSGTAVRIKTLFERAGAVEKNPIQSIRSIAQQREIGVPDEFLDGHGWHKYSFSFKKSEQANYLLNTCYQLFQQITNDDVVMEGKYLLGSWENSSETLSIEFKCNGANIIFAHNVNGRVPYIDGLFDTVLPAMVKMIENGDTSVKDMFDL